jgi:NTP pyrophosphatase (non-canonical NTP hydrolase)
MTVAYSSDQFSIIKESDLGQLVACDEYQDFVTALNQAGFQATCLGLAGECGELLDAIKKRDYHGVEITKDTIEDELGDVLFYVVALASAEGLNIADVMKRNTAKLKARYPRGYTSGGGVRKPTTSS